MLIIGDCAGFIPSSIPCARPGARLCPPTVRRRRSPAGSAGVKRRALPHLALTCAVDTVMAGSGRPALFLALVVALCPVPGLCGETQEEGAVRTVTSSNWTAVLEGQWMVTL